MKNKSPINTQISPNVVDSLLESLSESIIVFDPGLVAMQANPAALAEWGFDPAGMHASEIAKIASLSLAGGDPGDLGEVIIEVKSSGRAIKKPISYKNKRHIPVTALCTIAPIVTDGVTGGAVMSFLRQDSAPVSGERLAAERDRLITILDSIEDGVYICDSQFRVEYANSSLVSKLGNPNDKRCFEYLYKSDTRCPWCHGDEAWNGKTIRWEWTDPVSGRVYDILEMPLQNLDGTISKLKIFHDITATKDDETRMLKSKQILENRVERMAGELATTNLLLVEKLSDLKIRDRQLRSQSEVLEKIFSNTHLLIAFLNPELRFIRVNSAWSAMDGRPPDFFSGKKYFDIYPDAETEKIFSGAAESKTPYIAYARAFPFAGSQGTDPGYCDWSLQPVTGDGRALEGLILTLSDVTQKTKTERELVEAQANLAEAKRLSDIGVLAATVAHELRNPLSVIQAAIFNIKKKAGEGELQKHVSHIEKKLGESERIINNLLNYSNIKQPRLKHIHLYYFLSECLDTLEEQYRALFVSIIKDFEDFKETVIEIDPFQIREVMFNVFNNACQALPEKEGTIEVSGAIEAGENAVIRISDNGEGIAPEHLEKVFLPFFTLKSRGTGLGLAICQELVKLHNGEISIQSEPGKGTSVRILLPLRHPANPKMQIQAG